MHSGAWVLWACSAASVPQAEPPPLEFPQDTAPVDFRQSEAKSLDDLFGRAVLVDLFASWCAPCARHVSKLRGLHEELGPRGLFVLGVTSDAEAEITPWVERLRATYAYAFDPELAFQIELGFQSLPFALLLDPEGCVVWSGDPGALDAPVLERALAGALTVPTWSWPASASELRQLLADDQLARARNAARGLADWPEGKAVAELIAKIEERRTREAEEALARGDYRLALARAERWRERVDAAHRARLDQVLHSIRSSAAATTALERQRELESLWKSVADVGSKEAASRLLARIAALAEGTSDPLLAQRAELHTRAIRRFMTILR